MPDRAEAQRVWNYPFRALEESVVNALYHRNWEVREPVEIRILPDCIEIVNQGGPDRNVKREELQKGIIHNRRYRNRRIGDFLKELDMTGGRGTGIPIIRREMEKNGSPEPRFETDENHSYFITTLPIHPAFLLEEEMSEGVCKGVKPSEGQHDPILKLIREGVNEGVNENVYEIINILINVPGLNAVEIASRTKRGLSTVERYLRLLREKEIVEFKGVPKTGGYYLTQKSKDKLK